MEADGRWMERSGVHRTGAGDRVSEEGSEKRNTGTARGKMRSTEGRHRWGRTERLAWDVPDRREDAARPMTSA